MSLQSRPTVCRRLWLAAAAVMAAASWLPADDQAASNKEAAKRRQAANVRAMQAVAEGLIVVRLTDDGEAGCKMTSKSVLNWSDPARHPEILVPGTTWIWHHQGRPQLIAEIYGRDNAVGRWNVYMCTLSPDRVRVENAEVSSTIDTSYYEPRELPKSPAAAATKPARLLQMNRLARRFDGHQFWDGGRFELRLLPRHIYRYQDPAAGIVDGAVYALVHGTNPEVLLLLEAHASGDDPARWKVSFGALAGASCVVRLDGEEFWTCPLHTSDTADPRRYQVKEVPLAEQTP